MRVMSYNLRFDTPRDGEYQWPKREPAVRWVWEYVNADVVGVQEGLPHQLENLAEWMPEYDYVGRGREADGSGEHVAIFYKRDTWRCLEHGNFWLSDTPDVPGSRTFGNRLPRMATWARLKNSDGHVWLVLNTHLDHESEEARAKGAALIKSFLAENAKDEPVIVTGDFNAEPGSAALETLLEGGALVDVFAAAGADGLTVHGYNDTPNARIDYILASPQVPYGKLEIVREKPYGLYPSDHYPIYADLEAYVGAEVR